MLKKKGRRAFLSSSVVETPCFQCKGAGSIPGRGTKIPQVQDAKKKKRGNPACSIKTGAQPANHSTAARFPHKSAFLTCLVRLTLI